MEAPNLSPTERLILANQYRILSFLDEENTSAHQEKEEIVRRGWRGQYDSLFDNLSDEVATDVTEETHDILEMFYTIAHRLEELTEEEKKQLDLRSLVFQGFDGNHDPHYRQLKFMVEKRDLYDELKGQNLNSRTQTSLMKYRRQLPVFKRLRDNGQDTTIQGLAEIANA
jgi:uncharacterized protein YfbU (UPF0304 family)